MICLQGLTRLVVLILYFDTLMVTLMVLELLRPKLISCSHAPNSPTLPTNTNKLNTNNDNDATALSTSKDHPTKNNATLSPDDVVLLSTVFPQHSLMVNQVWLRE